MATAANCQTKRVASLFQSESVLDVFSLFEVRWESSLTAMIVAIFSTLRETAEVTALWTLFSSSERKRLRDPSYGTHNCITPLSVVGAAAKDT